ncbi:hypothetical protein ABE485_06370 [Achromobacter spanius]|uniref:hypothetical protein n=1 Tax=Achromobacter spanius TaxID=217203 RepID=UPI00320AF510
MNLRWVECCSWKPGPSPSPCHDFAALTDREKALLESITAAFLAFVLAQRAYDEDSTDHMH